VTRLLVFVLLPAAALAQSAIQGSVLDPSGAAVPDASITATLNATGAVRAVHTDPDGRYRIPALPIGAYTIRCEKAGFQRAEVPQVQLSVNQTLEQTIQLKLASADSSIDVRDQPEALNTTAPTAGVALGGETLEETPSQNRSYLGVVLLAPGVAPAAGSNTLRTKAGIRSAAPDSGFTFAGMRARSNSLSIDGLDNRDETTGSSRVAIGQEAVAEFRVTASNVAPEFGGGAGGNLNVVTLSGTNRFHGDINLFAADSFLEARNPKRKPASAPTAASINPKLLSTVHSDATAPSSPVPSRRSVNPARSFRKFPEPASDPVSTPHLPAPSSRAPQSRACLKAFSPPNQLPLRPHSSSPTMSARLRNSWRAMPSLEPGSRARC